MSRSAEIVFPPPKYQEFVFGCWTIKAVKSHIMGSSCEADSKCDPSVEPPCNLCRFEQDLTLPSLPDMVFASNLLQITHRSGGSISFNCFDALKCVNDREDTLQVAHADAWKEARVSMGGKYEEYQFSRDLNSLGSQFCIVLKLHGIQADCEFAKKVVKPYDWTYTTNFRGTIAGDLKVEDTTERIDLQKLKAPEEIVFYEEIFLYEDELDDNGSTRCVVKVRVMPSGFFVVFRHYLRVDHVIVRVNDTRLYSPAGASYIIRETSLRESPISKLQVPAHVYKNPDQVWQHLPLVKESVDKLSAVE